MVCDGLRCLYKLKIAGKWPISSHRVAGPIHATHTQYILVFGWDRPFATIRWALQHLINFKSMAIKCVSLTTVKLQ